MNKVRERGKIAFHCMSRGSLILTLFLSIDETLASVKFNKILHRNHQSSWFIGSTPYSKLASNVNEFYSKISGISIKAVYLSHHQHRRRHSSSPTTKFCHLLRNIYDVVDGWIKLKREDENENRLKKIFHVDFFRNISSSFFRYKKLKEKSADWKLFYDFENLPNGSGLSHSQ